MYENFSFKVISQSSNSKARLGQLSTPHGVIETPAFIFCATKAAVKALAPNQMREAGTQIILSNTYHLMLQPGADYVEQMGGLQVFTGWRGPMLTDSGGFQIFSLGHGSVAEEIKGKGQKSKATSVLKIEEEGVLFKSYVDGAKHLLTPEKSLEVQRKLGADLIVVLDECTPYHVDKSYTETSMYLSHRWALRSLEAFRRHDDGKQALYGIVQGGVYDSLRSHATSFVNEHPFFGHAIGGSLGASKNQMYEIVALCMERLDPKRPVHLLGIGGFRDILMGVRHGIDTFDCVHPTRVARHGGALVPWFVRAELANDLGRREHINLWNAQFSKDRRPIDETCDCHTCQSFSRGYLRYLLKANEILALQALSLHNVTTMNRFLDDIRQGIKADTLKEVEQFWVGLSKNI